LPVTKKWKYLKTNEPIKKFNRSPSFLKEQLKSFLNRFPMEMFLTAVVKLADQQDNVKRS
jgi:hypothetical protein